MCMALYLLFFQCLFVDGIVVAGVVVGGWSGGGGCCESIFVRFGKSMCSDLKSSPAIVSLLFY